MRNHFAIACKAKKPPPAKVLPLRRNRKSVNTVEDSDSDEYVASVDVKERVCAVEDQL